MLHALLILMIISAIQPKLLHTQTTLQDQNIIYYDALMAKENELQASLAQI
jgi:hypothetical protein